MTDFTNDPSKEDAMPVSGVVEHTVSVATRVTPEHSPTTGSNIPSSLLQQPPYAPQDGMAHRLTPVTAPAPGEDLKIPAGPESPSQRS